METLYKHFLRPILFMFNAEQVHNLVTGTLRLLTAIPGVLGVLRASLSSKRDFLHREVMGLQFGNPIGLAAGFDKNAEFLHAFSAMGFGFIEIGTVTPRAQPGNPKPRLFRLKKDRALINRMGFNNHGVQQVVKNLSNRPPGLIVGGNIGKNKDTPNVEASADYEACFEQLYDHVDYFVVNVSSPNTPGLRHLQERAPLQELLNRLQQINARRKPPKPILLKIAPDLSKSQLDDIVDIVVSTGIAGVIATNTTVDRVNLRSEASAVHAMGAGGLSGPPLKHRSTEVIRYIRDKAPKDLVIIGAGGISTVHDAIEKLSAGADLLQLYTGLVYEGPTVVRKISKGLSEYLQSSMSRG